MPCPLKKTCKALVSREYYEKYCKTNEFKKCLYFISQMRDTAPPYIWEMLEEGKEEGE